jgi:hypothetical protein
MFILRLATKPMYEYDLLTPDIVSNSLVVKITGDYNFYTLPGRS